MTETILISFPRSGANWVRYVVESVTGRPTPGYKKLVVGDDYVFHRTHDVRVRHEEVVYEASVTDDAGKPLHKRALLLLRNPLEIFVREIMIARKTESVKAGLPQLGQLLANLEFYAAFTGPKLLVHYEDLIADFSHMERILLFLGIPFDRSEFDLEAAIKASTDWYDEKHGAFTRADPKDFKFHSRRLSQQDQKAILEYLTAHASPAVIKYLQRY